MANSVTIKINGLDDLEDKLDNLPSKFAKQAMWNALRPAANIWKEAIAAAAPERTGWLKSQAEVSIRLSAKEESGTALVGFSKKQNPALLGKKKNVPSAANEALWYELGTVRGERAQPFIRPAFEAFKTQVLDTFVDKLKEAFSEVFGG